MGDKDMDLAEYNATRPTWKWYTFVVRLDLSSGNIDHKGMNSWDMIVYRKGDTLEEAMQKINEDFDSPFVIAAFEGRLEKFRGFYPTDFPWEPKCPYKFEER